MTVFFTKTCARDYERCCYQMLAIRRLFPLSTHIVLAERAEFSRTPAWKDLDLGFAMQRGVPGQTRTFNVEDTMPEAMRIEDPDLRQQYCKLRAPVVFGTDMIQLDSDMCPKPLGRWADCLFGTVLNGRSSDFTRCNAPVASKAMQPAVENWLKTYAHLFEVGPNTPRDRDFMRSQFGWYIHRELARDFLKALGPDPIAKILEVVEERRLKFSEYQLLGMWAYDMSNYPIRFINKAEEQPWLYHFTSKETLEPEQRTLLRKAAGLEE